MSSFDDRDGAAVVVEVGHDGTANGDAGRLQNGPEHRLEERRDGRGRARGRQQGGQQPREAASAKGEARRRGRDRGGVGVGGEGRGRGGTALAPNGRFVLVAPLKVRVPRDVPPSVTAAVAVVLLAVMPACPNVLFDSEQVTALRLAVPCAPVTGMSRVPPSKGPVNWRSALTWAALAVAPTGP